MYRSPTVHGQAEGEDAGRRAQYAVRGDGGVEEAVVEAQLRGEPQRRDDERRPHRLFHRGVFISLRRGPGRRGSRQRGRRRRFVQLDVLVRERPSLSPTGSPRVPRLAAEPPSPPSPPTRASPSSSSPSPNSSPSNPVSSATPACFRAPTPPLLIPHEHPLVQEVHGQQHHEQRVAYERQQQRQALALQRLHQEGSADPDHAHREDEGVTQRRAGHGGYGVEQGRWRLARARRGAGGIASHLFPKRVAPCARPLGRIQSRKESDLSAWRAARSCPVSLS